MKLTKEQNPYSVKIGQVWTDRDSARPNEFVVKKLTLVDGDPYAEVYRESTDKRVSIRLDRFNKYALVG